jgi:hypothetical protein
MDPKKLCLVILNIFLNGLEFYRLSFKLTHNVKALAMWLEFIAVSAWLPMHSKGKMF